MRATTYFDVLDTVRTISGRAGPYGSRHDLGATHLLLSFLLGETPLLSQPQAFDSGLLLGSVLTPREGKQFIRIVKRGDIRFPAWQGRDLLSAFRQAVENPEFKFSLWQELNGSFELRREVLAGLDGMTHDLPKALDARLDGLRQLDAGIRVASLKQRHEAHPTGTSLQSLLENVRDQATNDSLQQLLNRLSRIPSSNRSEHHLLLDRLENRRLAEQARAVVDMCYNRIIAKSLGARIVSYSAPDLVPIQVFQPLLENSNEATTSTYVKETRVDSYSGLAHVGWTEVAEVRHHLNEKELTEKGRRAEVADFLAVTTLEKGGLLYRILPQVASRLFGGIREIVDEAAFEDREIIYHFARGAVAPNWEARGAFMDGIRGVLARRYSKLLRRRAHVSTL